jgi:hypothetical protein
MRGSPMRRCPVRCTMRGAAMRRRASVRVHRVWLHLLRLLGTLLEIFFHNRLGLRLLTATDGSCVNCAPARWSGGRAPSWRVAISSMSDCPDWVASTIECVC